MEKLGTDDDELDNIADLIIKKSIRKQSQVKRLMKEVGKIIEKKPKFRTIFLQKLQMLHGERKQLRKENREMFNGFVLLLVEGKCEFLSSFLPNLELKFTAIKFT